MLRHRSQIEIVISIEPSNQFVVMETQHILAQRIKSNEQKDECASTNLQVAECNFKKKARQNLHSGVRKGHLVTGGEVNSKEQSSLEIH